MCWMKTEPRTKCENKTVIDRRLRPRCCHRGSYFERPKSSPMRPLACNWYYCAQFIAKPKVACALRFSWAATSSNLGLWANMTSSIRPEVHNLSLRRQKMTEPRQKVTCTKKSVKIGRVVLKIWSRTDKHTDRQTETLIKCSTPLSSHAQVVSWQLANQSINQDFNWR